MIRNNLTKHREALVWLYTIHDIALQHTDNSLGTQIIAILFLFQNAQCDIIDYVMYFSISTPLICRNFTL